MHECDYYLELCSALLDGELAADRAIVVRDHLEQCDSCRCSYNDMKAAAGVVRLAFSSVRAPASLRASLGPILDANPSAVERPSARRRARWKLVFAPAAAVAAVILLTLTNRPPVPLETLDSRIVLSSSARVFTTPEATVDATGAETGVSVQPVNLKPMGLSFAGGGKASCGGCPGAYMAFKDSSGRHITVFELCTKQRRLPPGERAPSSQIEAATLTGRDGTHLVFWPQDGVLFVVATDISAEHALRASEIVSSQIQSD